jgi:hypothetical protein
LYKVVKRRRGQAEPSAVVDDEKERFNTVARCSLKELTLCFGLLEERHKLLVREAGLGHIGDFKIRTNINRRLMSFLMYNIDPVTMNLDLGDGTKIIQINADAIHKLFALPFGENSPPRPSDSIHDDALMRLKAELGYARNKQIETKDLRRLLANLVKDPANDALALKVFGLVLYNKFICPGYTTRVSREAAMVEDFDILKLKDFNLCQLVVDELRKAVLDWQASKSDWAAIPGCAIAPLLMYLDCIDHRKLNPRDKRTPRALFMNPSNLLKLSDLDCIKEGDWKPSSWIYGKLPVSTLSSFILVFFLFLFHATFDFNIVLSSCAFAVEITW